MVFLLLPGNVNINFEIDGKNGQLVTKLAANSSVFRYSAKWFDIQDFSVSGANVNSFFIRRLVSDAVQ